MPVLTIPLLMTRAFALHRVETCRVLLVALSKIEEHAAEENTPVTVYAHELSVFGLSSMMRSKALLIAQEELLSSIPLSTMPYDALSEFVWALEANYSTSEDSLSIYFAESAIKEWQQRREAVVSMSLDSFKAVPSGTAIALLMLTSFLPAETAHEFSREEIQYYLGIETKTYAHIRKVLRKALAVLDANPLVPFTIKVEERKESSKVVGLTLTTHLR